MNDEADAEEAHDPDADAPPPRRRLRVPLRLANWGLFVLWIGLGVGMAMVGFPQPRLLWAGVWFLAGATIIAGQWVDRMRARRADREPPPEEPD